MTVGGGREFVGDFLRRGVRFGFLAGVKFLFLDVFQPLPQKIVKVRAEPGPVALAAVRVNFLIHSHEIVLEGQRFNCSGGGVHSEGHIRVVN